MMTSLWRQWKCRPFRRKINSSVVVCQLVCRLAVNILNIIFSHALTICRLVDEFDAKMCELTLQMILLCNCSLSLNVFNIGLQCNLRFLCTTVLQGSAATRMNYGRTFNDFFIANLLLSVTVKEFWRSARIWQSYGEKWNGTFFPDTVYM